MNHPNITQLLAVTLTSEPTALILVSPLHLSLHPLRHLTTSSLPSLSLFLSLSLSLSFSLSHSPSIYMQEHVSRRLLDVLHSSEVSETEVVSYAKQVAAAMHYLHHKLDVLHCDLAARNISF